MAKHPLTPRKCWIEHKGILVKANNNTTVFQYLWCPADRIVHKDFDFEEVPG